MKWSRYIIVAAILCAAGCRPQESQSTSKPSESAAAPTTTPSPAEQAKEPSETSSPRTVRIGPMADAARDQTKPVLVKVTPPWLKYPGEPGPRYAIDLVWDDASKRVLLFGGGENVSVEGKPQPDIKYFNDLWAWHPERYEWEKIETSDVAPSPRAYYAAAYDAKRNGVWLHGGSHDYTLSDLWFYDCAKSEWREIEIVASERPEMRAGHTMQYNPKSDELYMFGGVLSWNTMQLSHEFWAFDCKTAKWTRKPLGPLARFMHLAALDDQNQKIYITGGFGINAKYTEEKMWEYDIPSEQWTSYEDKLGSKILAGRMEFVPSRGCLVAVCGGDSNLECRYDLKTHTWKKVRDRLPLPPRGFHGMTIDPDGNQLFVYGGTFGAFFGGCLAPELWVRDLTRNAPLVEPVGKPGNESGSPAQ